MVNSRAKGAAGEREWANYCKDAFGLSSARRSQQYCGTADTQDVLSWPGCHAEVKRVERLNVDDAMVQAVRDSEGKSIPYVAHRKNHGDWMVTVRAKDLVRFAKIVAASRTDQNVDRVAEGDPTVGGPGPLHDPLGSNHVRR